jgi:hypothetical protein
VTKDSEKSVKRLYCGSSDGSHEKQLYLLVNGRRNLYPFHQGEEKLAETADIKETLKESLGAKFVK